MAATKRCDRYRAVPRVVRWRSWSERIQHSPAGQRCGCLGAARVGAYQWPQHAGVLCATAGVAARTGDECIRARLWTWGFRHAQCQQQPYEFAARRRPRSPRRRGECGIHFVHRLVTQRELQRRQRERKHRTRASQGRESQQRRNKGTSLPPIQASMDRIGQDARFDTPSHVATPAHRNTQKQCHPHSRLAPLWY